MCGICGEIRFDDVTPSVEQVARMNRVRSVDVDNLALVAEAGCVLESVQQVAAGHGLRFPLSLAAEGSCTIGGNLATNAGGTEVLRFGNARRLICAAGKASVSAAAAPA